MSRAVEAGSCPRSARRSRSDAVARPSTCRCRTRRRGRASRPARGRTRRRRRRGRPPPPPTSRAAAAEVLDEAVDLEHAALVCVHAAPLARPGWKQATRCAGRTSRELAAPRRGSVGRARGQRGGERAAVGELAQRRHAAGDLAQARRCRRCRRAAGSRRAAPIVYGCCGVGEQLVDRRLLDLAAGVHHEHAVGDLGDDAEVVGDQDDRRAEPLADVAQQVEDPRLDRHVERGRRLVGDQQLRVAGERHRDHHALPHAARELVRVLVDAPLRRRDATSSSSSIARARACAPRQARGAAAAPRRSARRRVNTGLSEVIGSWKTNEISRPADRAQLALGRARAGRRPSKRRAPLTVAVVGQQPQERQRVTLLPQPDSPTMPSTSPAPSVEREPSTACDGAVVGLEPHREVRDLEQGRRRQRVVRGSRTSRRPSPSRLNASAQSTIARPG